MPKTGGRTIKKIFDLKDLTLDCKWQGHGSINDASKEEKDLILSGGYFKFTFVRDPVERFISAFFWGRRHHPRRALRYKSLRDYINYSKENVHQDIVLKPQAYYFINTKYDFIGFTDTLSADAESLRQAIGFPDKPFGHVGRYNVGTPEKVRGSLDSFVSPKERQAIEKMYEEDCELFKKLKSERK
tara:strand:+ start:14 stop:571 length:558 start_codon:yes stop_codon:yes gene_type:complete